MPDRQPLRDDRATDPTSVQLLTFEARWTTHTGAKEIAIQRELRLTPGRYYQLLSRAIDTREGIAHDPHLTAQIREKRARVLGFIARTESTH